MLLADPMMRSILLRVQEWRPPHRYEDPLLIPDTPDWPIDLLYLESGHLDPTIHGILQPRDNCRFFAGWA